MKRNLIRDHLQNLKAVLRKILGYSVTGDKYIHAIEEAIERIEPNENNKTTLVAGPYKGIMLNKNGDLSFKVKLRETDETIDNIVYYANDIIDAEEGEA